MRGARLIPAVLAALALVFAAACSDEDTPTPTLTAVPTLTPTVTPTSVPATATPTPSPSPTPATPAVTSTPTATPSLPPTVTPTPTATIPSLEDLALGVVRVETYVRNTSGGFDLTGWGSGSIVTEDGLVLSNYHVIDPDPEATYDEIGIAFTTDPGLAPETRYFADVVAVDPVLDLSVLKIARDLEGNEVDAGELDLPLIQLGDSSAVGVGDSLNIIGYPAIGADTITFTRGQVSGFLSQEGVGETRAWIKTDAVFAPGNSGGAAFDGEGRLIGIPTRVTIDTGGSINRVRPVNLAADVIAEGEEGNVVVLNPTKQEDTPTPVPAGEISIGNIAFGRDRTEEGELIDITDEFDEGTTAIYYTFDYTGMDDGLEWLDRWYLNGVELPEFSAPREPWDHGASGTLITNISDPAGLRSGEYAVEILVEGEVRDSASAYVGEPAPAITVDNVIFAAGQEDDEPVNVQESFPSETKEIYAFFDFAGAGSVKTFQFKWFRDGTLTYESKETPWAGGESGNWWVSIFSDTVLADGKYTIELLFDGAKVASADVGVGGAPVDPATFTPSTFALDVDADGNPVDPVTEITVPVNKILFFFDYSGMTNERSWKFVWTLDGDVVYDSGEAAWDLDESGTAWVSVFNEDEPLGSGNWVIQILLEGSVAAQADIDVQ